MKSIQSLERDWNDLAEIDPMWAIASVPGKEHNQWDITDFYNSGKPIVGKFLNIVNKSAVSFFPGTALDFGCGMGRLTQPLTEVFNVCYGVDISEEMINSARAYNRFGERCKYILNKENNLKIFDNEFFDFILTYIVLQHMPPEMMKAYLKEFIRILKPKGLLVFQVPLKFPYQDTKTLRLKSLPKFHPDRLINKLKGIFIGYDITERYYRLRKLGFSQKWLYDKFGLRPRIEMHYLQEEEVKEFLDLLEAKILSIDYETEKDVISGIFLVKKSS